MAAEQADLLRRRSHTLRIRLDADPPHLNPMLDPEVATLRITEDTIFETLLRYDATDAGGPGTYQPGLAESWRISGDGREIRLVIRDKVTFHDGDRFSVEDALYSIDAARSGHVRAPHFRAALGAVQSVEIASPRELRITLRRPDAFVLRVLAEIPMLPYHLYKGTELGRNPANKAPIGTGPYQFVSWKRGEKVVLARHDRYWGSAPAIEAIEFLIEPDGARAITRAKQGEIDVLPAVVPEHHPGQTAGMSDDFAELRLRPIRFQYVVMATGRAPFDDVRVRHAAALLVDRDKLARDLRHGFARPVAGAVWPGGPGDGATPAPPPFDPVAAARILDDAGWTDADGDGVREKGAEKLHIVMLATSDSRDDVERDLIVSGLRRGGFVIQVRSGEPAVLMNRLRDGDFDVALVEWRGRVDSDLAPLFSTAGALNWGGFSSRAVDAMLASISVTWEPAARAARVGELAELLAQEWPIVPLTAFDPIGLLHRRVAGLVVRDGWFRLRSLSLVPGR